MADAAARNARLDALLTATQTWATKRRKELTDRASIGKQILRGRSGSERLARNGVEAASTLVVDELDDFLLSP